MSSARGLFDALGNALDPVWDRVSLHQRIDESMNKVLPQALRRHVKIGCVDNSTLILFCDTPAWASDIRYREKQILDIVNSCEPLGLTRCRVMVRAELFQPS